MGSASWAAAVRRNQNARSKRDGLITDPNGSQARRVAFREGRRIAPAFFVRLGSNTLSNDKALGCRIIRRHGARRSRPRRRPVSGFVRVKKHWSRFWRTGRYIVMFPDRMTIIISQTLKTEPLHSGKGRSVPRRVSTNAACSKLEKGGGGRKPMSVSVFATRCFSTEWVGSLSLLQL